MEEVTIKNFNSIYPKLEETLRNATFISIDSEFTGIKVDDKYKESLFDSTAERYAKLKRNIEPFIIVQYGITALQHVPKENTYKSKSFNFSLTPRSTTLKHRQFSWQVEALEFLSLYNFNFNQAAYDGISYLDEEDEALFKEQLKNEELIRNVERRVSYREEDDIKDYKNRVAEWLNNSEDSVSFQINNISPLLQYLLHKELRAHFVNIWTLSSNNSITVIKIMPGMSQVLAKEEGDALESALLNSYLGFSKVFKLLASLKKPIIGHNLLLDLMFMHQQFYRPLPKDYGTFKKNMHQLFPVIYDTKHISFLLEPSLQHRKWKTNSLSCLYEYFAVNGEKPFYVNVPVIKMADGSSTTVPLDSYHTAGWDAYFAGYIFIQMAYLFSVEKFGPGLTGRQMTNAELINSVKEYANCINLIRSTASHLRLDGPEPKSTRPQWLYVKPLESQLFNIAERFSAFGTVDVMPFSRKRVLVAVSNHGSARDILRHFRYNKELYVVPYSPLRHSIPHKVALWSTVVVSGGVFAWMLHRTFQKSV